MPRMWEGRCKPYSLRVAVCQRTPHVKGWRMIHGPPCKESVSVLS
jgi:hypothetical protein